MQAFVALLRAVNVGGTGKLAMADLRAICEGQGHASVRTYIASGNVVFRSDQTEATITSELSAALRAHAGRDVGVLLRTAAEMAAVVTANPFASAPPNRTVAIFLNASPPENWRGAITGLADEEVAPGTREIYVRYGAGMAGSKLRIPAAAAGTARNMNTVAKLAAMAAN